MGLQQQETTEGNREPKVSPPKVARNHHQAIEEHL